MFTTILGPFGKSYQINTGWDNCDTYMIGDKIPWKPDPLYPGDHIDGVHLGYGERDNDTLVVIKDCTVAAILPRRWDKDLDIEIAMRKKEYGIKLPARSLWSEEAWAAKEARDKKAKEEASRSKPQLVCNYCGADFTGMSPEEIKKHLNTHKYTVAERRVLLPSDKEIEELLRELINGNNLENLCDTPDFILARFMARCLKAFEDAVNARDGFYGIHPEPRMRPANTAGEATEFGPSPLEDAMTDPLGFQKVKRKLERIQRHHQLEAKLRNLRLRRDLKDPEFKQEEEDAVLDEMEALYLHMTEEERKTLEAERATRLNRAPVDPIVGKGKHRVGVEIGNTEMAIFYDIDPDTGIPLSLLLEKAKSDLAEHGISIAVRKETHKIIQPKPEAQISQDEYERITRRTITTTVSNCARCGGTHEHLNFRKLSGEPIGEYTHWAMCPKTGEPIALLITMQMGKEGHDPK